MPDQWERHGKSSGWGPFPSRGQTRDEAAHDDPVHASSPGKKDAYACKSNHWNPHSLVIRRRIYGWSFNPNPHCEWGTQFDSSEGFIPAYKCNHYWQCEACGKWFHKIHAEECPDFTPEPSQKIWDDCDQATAKWDARRARRVLKAPAHYRKPKAGK